MTLFTARWGLALCIISALGTTVCLAAAVFGGAVLVRAGQVGPAILICLLLLWTVVGCALFTVRGYSIAPGVLLVHRMFWATPVSLAGLEAVNFEPGAMRWSLRTWGNGGLFAFCGYYWNRRLGSYRAFVTDLNNTVVLRLPGRAIVISPDAPEQFVYEIWKAQEKIRS